MKNILITTLLISFFFMAQAQEKTDTVVVFKPAILPKGYTQQLDIIYTSGLGWNKNLDLYLPPNPGKPTPVIINLHGGGWVSGVKEQQSSGFEMYFNQGYAVVNIEYRMTKEAKAPAAVEDARCALIYVVKNAKALNIDTNKIVVVGGSAGGHLAMMMGLLENDHRFDQNCMGVQIPKLAAIIDKWGINDVWAWAYCCKSHSAQNWLGDKKGDEAFANTLSPIHYINKNSPPIFIVHGDADSTVPYQQSVTLHEKLKLLGVKTEFITVPGGGHGKFTKEQTTDVNNAIIRFIKNLAPFSSNKE